MSDPVATSTAPATPAPEAAPVATPAAVVDAGKPAVSPATPAAPTAVPAAKSFLTAEAPKAEATPAAAPVAVDWKLEAPKDSLLSKTELASLEKVAKDAGLTQPQALKFLSEQSATKTAEVARVNDAWYAEAMAHPDLGGAKMPQTQANVKRAMAAILPQAMREQIAGSPFANNPTFLFIMNAVAGLLPKEDSALSGAAPTGGQDIPRTPAEAARLFYGNRK